jgi:hypothetical protein
MSLADAGLLDELALDDEFLVTEQATSTNSSTDICNGMATCMPLVEAVIRAGSGDTRSDMQNLLDSAKQLIYDIQMQLEANGYTLASREKGAVNALCIQVCATNYANSQEVLGWNATLTNLICCSQISAESDSRNQIVMSMPEFLSIYTQAANTIINTLVFTEGHSIDLVNALPEVLRFLEETVDSAINEASLPIDQATRAELKNVLLRGGADFFCAAFVRDLKSHNELILQMELQGAAQLRIRDVLRKTKVELVSLFNALISLKKGDV